MKTFQTLQEVVDYIPTCVICHKGMKLSIEGYVKPVSTSKPRWNSGSQLIYLKMEEKDGLLRGTHKNESVAIEPATNRLVEGEDLVNRLMLNTINVKKCCPTCVFKFNFVYQAGNTKKTHKFPPIALQSEELNYTLRGGKRCHITRHYQFNQDEQEVKCNIRVNYIEVTPVNLDFSKLTDLDQINRKIKTVLTFQ